MIHPCHAVIYIDMFITKSQHGYYFTEINLSKAAGQGFAKIMYSQNCLIGKNTELIIKSHNFWYGLLPKQLKKKTMYVDVF